MKTKHYFLMGPVADLSRHIEAQSDCTYMVGGLEKAFPNDDAAFDYAMGMTDGPTVSVYKQFGGKWYGWRISTEQWIEARTGCYNTDLFLWESQRKAAIECSEGKGMLLTVDDGHIVSNGEVLARFESTEDAERTLVSAGWVMVSDHCYKSHVAHPCAFKRGKWTMNPLF